MPLQAVMSVREANVRMMDAIGTWERNFAEWERHCKGCDAGCRVDAPKCPEGFATVAFLRQLYLAVRKSDIDLLEAESVPDSFVN